MKKKRAPEGADTKSIGRPETPAGTIHHARKAPTLRPCVTRLQWAIEHGETPDGAGAAQCAADLIRAIVREEIGAATRLLRNETKPRR